MAMSEIAESFYSGYISVLCLSITYVSYNSVLFPFSFALVLPLFCLSFTLCLLSKTIVGILCVQMQHQVYNASS